MNFENEDSDPEQELFPIGFQDYNSHFVYEDPLLVTGILRAVVEGNLNRVKELVSENKSVNINDNHGNTPLHVAVIKELSDILEYLLTLEDTVVNIRNFYGETPLFQAVKRGHLHLIKKLIDANCNVNLSNYEDVTPLHVAVKYPQIAHLLIKNGANINAQDYSGETPLHEAIGEKCIETVGMLLYYNADANVACDNNITPFMKSIILESNEIQEVLLNYVVDFNVGTNDGMTTLGLALTHSTPYVQEILDGGADINYEHERLNAFLMCVSVANRKNFELIWKGFEYQSLSDGINYWRALFTLHSVDDIYAYLEIIIESGNIAPFLEDCDLISYFSILKRRVTNKNNWLDVTTHLVCVLLSNGGLNLNSDIMDLIYDTYGYCELMDICLYMDIELQRMRYISMARIIYDPTLNVQHFVEHVMRKIRYNGEMFLKQFPPFARYTQSVSSTGGDPFFENDLKIVFEAPSLLELARNATREHLVNTFDLNTSKRFYSFLKFLDMSVIYKDIVSFKKPIYKI